MQTLANGELQLILTLIAWGTIIYFWAREVYRMITRQTCSRHIHFLVLGFIPIVLLAPSVGVVWSMPFLLAVMIFCASTLWASDGNGYTLAYGSRARVGLAIGFQAVAIGIIFVNSFVVGYHTAGIDNAFAQTRGKVAISLDGKTIFDGDTEYPVWNPTQYRGERKSLNWYDKSLRLSAAKMFPVTGFEPGTYGVTMVSMRFNVPPTCYKYLSNPKSVAATKERLQEALQKAIEGVSPPAAWPEEGQLFKTEDLETAWSKVVQGIAIRDLPWDDFLTYEPDPSEKIAVGFGKVRISPGVFGPSAPHGFHAEGVYRSCQWYKPTNK